MPKIKKKKADAFLVTLDTGEVFEAEIMAQAQFLNGFWYKNLKSLVDENAYQNIKYRLVPHSLVKNMRPVFTLGGQTNGQ